MAWIGLAVVVILPVVSNKAIVVFLPVALITMAGMWMKIMTVAWQAHDDIIAFNEGKKPPLWVNDCLQDEI